MPQREPQNQIYLENDHALLHFFLYNIGDMVTVSMITLDIVYIPMLKGTILSLTSYSVNFIVLFAS